MSQDKGKAETSGTRAQQPDPIATQSAWPRSPVRLVDAAEHDGSQGKPESALPRGQKSIRLSRLSRSARPPCNAMTSLVLYLWESL